MTKSVKYTMLPGANPAIPIQNYLKELYLGI